MLKKYRLRWVVLGIWMVIIYMFSNQPSNTSEIQSKRITRMIIHGVTLIIPVAEEKERELVKQSDELVRKVAHCCIYTILAVICYWVFNKYIKQKANRVWIYTMSICFGYAIIDEIHQTFIDGRSGEIRDVCIDCVGALLGCLIMWRITKKKTEYKNMVNTIEEGDPNRTAKNY